MLTQNLIYIRTLYPNFIFKIMPLGNIRILCIYWWQILYIGKGYHFFYFPNYALYFLLCFFFSHRHIMFGS